MIQYLVRANTRISAVLGHRILQPCGMFFKFKMEHMVEYKRGFFTVFSLEREIKKGQK